MSKVRLVAVDESLADFFTHCVDLIKVRIHGQDVYVSKEYFDELMLEGQFHKGLLVDVLV